MPLNSRQRVELYVTTIRFSSEEERKRFLAGAPNFRGTPKQCLNYFYDFIQNLGGTPYYYAFMRHGRFVDKREIECIVYEY